MILKDPPGSYLEDGFRETQMEMLRLVKKLW